MSGRIRNVTPKPGFVFDGQDVIRAPANVVPFGGAIPMRDGALANVMSGRGTSVDRSSCDHWTFIPKSPQQIEAAYRSSWLARQIVDIPAADMTRAGRDWDAEDDQITKIEAEEKRLGYWPKVYQALVLGRLGGGAIIIGMKDGRPDTPLPANVKPGDVQYLTVLSRYQVTLGEMEMDPASPLFGEPRYFRLAGVRSGIDIHPSRVIAFKGMPAPGLYMTSWEDQYWGDSVLQAVDSAVKQATTAMDGFASLIDEAKVDVFTMPGMYETLSQPGGEAKFMAALQAAAQGKSIYRMLALGEGETWETRQINWAGMPEVIKTYLSIVAGAADIPATRLLGKSPDGMNATGAGDERNYLAMIAAKQHMDLRPPLERLDAAVLPSAGVPTDLPWTFSPISTLSETEAAEIEAKEAESIVKLASVALIPETALAKTVQNRLIESGRFPGLKKLIEEAEAAGEELPGGGADLDIVPIPNGEKGGDPDLAGSGGQSGSGLPARRAANDAAPRTLYVSRKVQNVAEIKAWAKSQGLPELQDDLHVTLIYSRTPLDWMKVESEDWNQEKNGQIEIAPGGVRIVEPLGDRTAVLLFTSSRLSWRHEQIVRAGAEHGFPDYQPHISLTGAPVDLSNVEPYRGKIVLGPEVFEEVRSEGE